MSKTLEALSNNVILRKYIMPNSDETGLNLRIDEDEFLDTMYGIVVSIGPKVKEVVTGDIIICHKQLPTIIQLEADSYYAIEEKDILARINQNG